MSSQSQFLSAPALLSSFFTGKWFRFSPRPIPQILSLNLHGCALSLPALFLCHILITALVISPSHLHSYHQPLNAGRGTSPSFHQFVLG